MANITLPWPDQHLPELARHLRAEFPAEATRPDGAPETDLQTVRRLTLHYWRDLVRRRRREEARATATAQADAQVDADLGGV